jgi:murein DD-endopeptidase MepM/ murein hydrolase activator NlpD
MVDALKVGGFNPKGRAGQSSTIQATTQPSASISSIQLASTSSGGLTDVVPTLNFQKIGAGSGSVGMTSGRGQRWGRHHAGVDIGTSGEKGWYVAFKLSGTVTDAGTFPGYGKTVIITSGDKDFLFGHLAQITVRKGQQYNGEIIGEIGNTGRGTGEHLHFEVSPKGTGGYGNDEDPMPYVKYLQIGRLDPSGTPTPTTRLQPSTSTAARAQGVQQRASYEGGGSQVVTVPIPAGGQQQMMVGGQAGAIVLGGSTKAMVNSYYKSQLMGFLYKQG